MPSMKEPVLKVLFCSCSVMGVVLTMLAPTHSSAGRLVTFEQAGRHGLKRAWFAQASVDLTRGRIANWVLDRDRLISLSTSGTLQAINAETGETVWTARVGSPNGVFTGPAVNDRYVALTSGMKLYVLDRETGQVLWNRLLGSASVAAPALGTTHVFVGLLNGQVEGYSLEDLAETVWVHQSIGRIFHPPSGCRRRFLLANRSRLFVCRTERSPPCFVPCRKQR